MTAHTDDDELLAGLRRAAARLDGPPAALRDVTRVLHAWRDPDAAMAALVADSRQMAAAVRGPEEAILLRFRTGSRTLTVEITLSQHDDAVVVGSVEPAAGGRVSVRRSTSETVVDCDDLGRFRADAPGHGPISFRWSSGHTDDRPVDTPWMLI